MDDNPVPTILPGLVDPSIITGDGAMQQVRNIMNQFNNALATDDFEKLKGCFFPGQAYWKDQLALTYHLRTFTTPGVIATSLLETKSMRNVMGGIVADDEAHFIPVTSTLVSNNPSCKRIANWNCWLICSPMRSNLSIAEFPSEPTLPLPLAEGK